MNIANKTFVGLFAFLCVRGWERLWNANLWAEDGYNLARDAIVSAWPFLFKQIDGSFFFGQRIVVNLIWVTMPHAWFPTVTTIFCFGLHAFVASRIVGSEYEWLISNRRWRIAIAFLICYAPGMSEMAGNFANINWILFFWFAFLLLKDPRNSLRPFDWLLSAVVSLSCGTTVLLVPLAAYRAWLKPRTLWNAAPLIIILSVAIGLSFVTERVVEPIHRPVFVQLAVLIESFVDSALYQPWLGDWPTIAVTNFSRSLNLSVAILFAISMYRLLWPRRWEPRIVAMSLLLLGLFLWPYLCCLARPGRMKFFEDPLQGVFWRIRYSFPMAVGAYLFWYLLFSLVKNPRIAQRLAILFFGMNLIWGIYRYRIAAYGPESLWAAALPQIEVWQKTCAEKKIPVYPDGWHIELPNRCSH